MEFCYRMCCLDEVLPTEVLHGIFCGSDRTQTGGFRAVVVNGLLGHWLAQWWQLWCGPR